MNTRRILPAAFTLAVGLAFLVGSLNIDSELARNIGGNVGPVLYPIILAVLAMIIALVVLIEPAAPLIPGVVDEAETPMTAHSARGILALFALILAFLLLFRPLGYPLSAGLLVFGIMLIGGMRNILVALAATVFLVAGFYVVFNNILLVQLPETPWPSDWFPSAGPS